MRISLEMPDAVFGKLATLADTRSVKIGELISDAVEDLIGQYVPAPRRQGHPTVKVTPEVLAQAIADHDAGKSWRSIAEGIGVDVSTIYGAVRKATGKKSR